MGGTLSNMLRLLLCAVFTTQLIGCGTILHPERKGQRGGSLDAGIVILDGIGLLFFLIPGVIAFAVDFNNGTIYLPGGRSSSLNQKNIKEVKFDAKHGSMASIERIIKDETGYLVKLDQDNIKITKLRSLDDMKEQFARVQSVNQNDRLALL